MQETIQNLFAHNPYFAFAGFVALVAVCLYIIKKLKNIIIALLISFIILSVYLYRIEVISGETFRALFNIRSTEDAKELYDDFVNTQSEKIRTEAKQKIIESLQEDLEKTENTDAINKKPDTNE
ncbi:MAG: hypothetical protein PF637_05665 [Spirochaetes bacterium]|jgi:hypothetical protein|nr:hypothetical protein [Spirochaetota bacterium]